MSDIKYEPVRLEVGDVQRKKKEPFEFVWMKYEMPILIAITVIWASYIMIDFGLLMRSLVTNKAITIHGLRPGYFGIPRVV